MILPRITLITPSYQQAAWLEQTIESVLGQGYPNLQYLVVDGGSTDGSKAIIEKYQNRIDWWVSEPDQGQAHALNKGWAQADGEVVGWINSDDWLLPGALLAVGQWFAANPHGQWLSGQVQITDEAGNPTVLQQPVFVDQLDMSCFWRAWNGGSFVPQQASFWRRSAVQRPQLVREDYQCAMDFDLWMHMAVHTRPQPIAETLACYRWQADCKTLNLVEQFATEQLRTARQYWNQKGSSTRWRCETEWRQVLAHKHFKQAFAANQQQDGSSARKNWWRSAMAYPPSVLEWSTLNLGIRTHLGNQIIDRLK